MARPRVLSVGQCGFDHASIARQLRKAHDAEVIAAETADEALESLRAGPFDLVLVNRILDGDGSTGLDLIRTLKADPELAPVPVMLVSNFPDAQDEAVGLGALPGFGKSQLRDPEIEERLASALSDRT
jgi:two-component system chemotaxis response regulator CheY